MMKHKIEEMLLSPRFDYLQPYFYSNPYALRCELGIGTGEDYLANARARASEIHRILFPHGADAIIFSAWIYDWTDTGPAEEALYAQPEDIIAARIEKEMDSLRFLSECQMKYRHVSVKNLKTYCAPDDPDSESVRRNRMICYSDGKDFDDAALIGKQLADDNDLEIGLVSFENECILSVYDDRGCDVVFADAEYLRRFYPLLKPFFLAYDLEEMERRLH